MEQTLSAYKLFYTVAKCGNISYAAKELYISQPAISKGIRRLEENLGVQLFLRTSRGVSLTSEGQLLYQHVKTAFDELGQAEAQLRTAGKLGIRQLHIAASSTLCKYVLLPCLNDYLQEHPHVQVTIDCQPSHQILDMLTLDKVDIGLVGAARPLKGFRFQSLGKIQDIFVANSTYLERMHQRGLQSLEDLFRDSTVMLLDRDNQSRQYIDAYLNERRIVPEHLLEATTMDLLIEFAKIGLGIACVIREFVKDELDTGRLVQIPMDFHIRQREIGFVSKKGRQSSLSGSALEEFLSVSKNHPFSPADTGET